MAKTTTIPVEEQISKADILSGFKIPQKKGKGSLDKVITVNLTTNYVIFSKAMVFDLGYPKKIAFSFADDKVFIMPNPTLGGIIPYDIRKQNGQSDMHTIINNKDLCGDVALTVGIIEGKFELETKFYMEINGNKVYQLIVKDPKKS